MRSKIDFWLNIHDSFLPLASGIGAGQLICMAIGIATDLCWIAVAVASIAAFLSWMRAKRLMLNVKKPEPGDP